MPRPLDPATHEALAERLLEDHVQQRQHAMMEPFPAQAPHPLRDVPRQDDIGAGRDLADLEQLLAVRVSATLAMPQHPADLRGREGRKHFLKARVGRGIDLH